ncbi:MAG: YhgE/Pip domain-containing protein [Methanobrevibacter sp.]|uniref:YhgE/Pip domain-containing protein n=1 Tax=Methanobrevibacter sp. TaxID=66852 RepID=UPI0025D21754|nr:YhgE/Pip domain-containing protein [Methanobrevibacter sp.]MBQ8017347.1 YhgE/Pip domain-containing protein [Methanobrevibacter sp.]
MSGRDINNIVEIMKKDLKASFSNPIVIIVLVAIIILPSLYALINIQACWNPYENTGEIQFAIANLDKGASYEGSQLNVGNELVKELKNNTDFDWVFVTEDELRQGVHDGKYYAGMVIPEDLSEDVISITSDNPKSAKIDYVVNIKANPVANKLTDTASNAVYRTMNAKIVEFINLAAYGKLGELQSGLSSGASQLSSGATKLSNGASQVSSGADKVSSGASDLSNGADKVKTGASKVNDGADKVKSGSKAIDNGASEVSSSADKIKSGSQQVQQGASNLESSVDPSVLPSPVKDVVEGSVSLANSSSQLASGSSELAEGSVKLANSSSKLANGAGDVASGAKDVANGAGDVADGSNELAEGALSLAAGSQLLSSSASQALFSAASALSGASTSLSAVTGVNESQIGDYIYSPVKLEREEIFPVEDYGSNVAPFYLVLSMWVGAVITCVMLKPGTSTGTKYSPLEMYFGKLLLFIVMSLLQAAVTISGAFLLGVEIKNPLLFTFSAALVSVIFMVLMYSLISALGQVGKGIGVVLLVLQISGTGGIYPIEIMEHIFQIIYPYLPMTYAINLVREAQLGIVWSNYMPSLAVLMGIGIITVIVAVIIKEKAEDASHYFEERLEETDLF